MLALCLAASGTTLAHDFWIEPAKFQADTGEKIPLRLLVGQQFKGESVLYLPEHFERFVSVGPGGEHPIMGTRGDDPAGTLTLSEPGVHIVGYHSKKFDVTFENFALFEKYLNDEGLERHLEVATKRWKLRERILEIYTRCAKSLIKAGAAATQGDRVLGFPIELIAETNPYAIGAERQLNLQLLYRGKPLEGGLVIASNKREPQAKIKARTDKDGRVSLKLAHSGTWLVTSVHMIPAPLLSRADWESFWASLSFELP